MAIQFDTGDDQIACDAIEFVRFRAPQRRLSRGIVPGRTGETLHDLGEGDSAFEVWAHLYGADEDAVEVWLASIVALKALAGTITISNDLQTKSNLRVLFVGNEQMGSVIHDGNDEVLAAVTVSGTVEPT